MKTFHLSFCPQNLRTVFSAGKFDNCLVIILQIMTHVNVKITYAHSNFLRDVTSILLKDIVPNRHWCSNHLQHVPPWVLSIFPTPTHGNHNPFYQLTIHIPDNNYTSNFSQFGKKSLTLVVSLAICDPKLASVFMISCTRSGLLSLLRRAVIWAAAISIYMLQ